MSVAAWLPNPDTTLPQKALLLLLPPSSSSSSSHTSRCNPSQKRHHGPPWPNHQKRPSCTNTMIPHAVQTHSNSIYPHPDGCSHHHHTARLHTHKTPQQQKRLRMHPGRRWLRRWLLLLPGVQPAAPASHAAACRRVWRAWGESRRRRRCLRHSTRRCHCRRPHPLLPGLAQTPPRNPCLPRRHYHHPHPPHRARWLLPEPPSSPSSHVRASPLVCGGGGQRRPLTPRPARFPTRDARCCCCHRQMTHRHCRRRFPRRRQTPTHHLLLLPLPACELCVPAAPAPACPPGASLACWSRPRPPLLLHRRCCRCRWLLLLL